MTQKETIKKNIGLTFDFVNYLIDNQEELAKLPDNFKLEFIEKDSSLNKHKQHQNITQNLQNKYVKVKNSFDFTI